MLALDTTLPGGPLPTALSSAPLLLPSCTLDKHVLQGRILGWYERSGTRNRRDKEEGKTALLEGKTEKGFGLSRLSSLARETSPSRPMDGVNYAETSDRAIHVRKHFFLSSVDRLRFRGYNH